MCRRCRIEFLLVGVLAFQVAVVVVNVVIPVWRHTADSTDAPYSLANDSEQVKTFLEEYEKYCSSQLIPKTSSVINMHAIFGNLCPCVPDTLGKCLYPISATQMKYCCMCRGQLTIAVN